MNCSHRGSFNYDSQLPLSTQVRSTAGDPPERRLARKVVRWIKGGLKWDKLTCSMGCSSESMTSFYLVFARGHLQERCRPIRRCARRRNLRTFADRKKGSQVKAGAHFSSLFKTISLKRNTNSRRIWHQHRPCPGLRAGWVRVEKRMEEEEEESERKSWFLCGPHFLLPPLLHFFTALIWTSGIL